MSTTKRRRPKKKARPGGAGLALKREPVRRLLLQTTEYARILLALLRLAVQIGTLLAHHQS